MNMYIYTADDCYFFSRLTDQILDSEWLITWKSWIIIQSLNYDQSDNGKQQNYIISWNYYRKK